MNLPKPPPKKQTGPSMMDRNRELEAQQEQESALSLPTLQEVPTGKLSASPVSIEALDTFEEVYQQLKKQRRKLKRYQLADALLGSLEEPEVLAAVVRRLQ